LLLFLFVYREAEAESQYPNKGKSFHIDNIFIYILFVEEKEKAPGQIRTQRDVERDPLPILV